MDSDYLYYTVREPFPSKTSSATLVFGKITSRQPLRLISQTPEVGVIFSGGIESDFVAFNLASLCKLIDLVSSILPNPAFVLPGLKRGPQRSQTCSLS